MSDSDESEHREDVQNLPDRLFSPERGSSYAVAAARDTAGDSEAQIRGEGAGDGGYGEQTDAIAEKSSSEGGGGEEEGISERLGDLSVTPSAQSRPEAGDATETALNESVTDSTEPEDSSDHPPKEILSAPTPTKRTITSPTRQLPRSISPYTTSSPSVYYQGDPAVAAMGANPYVPAAHMTYPPMVYPSQVAGEGHVAYHMPQAGYMGGAYHTADVGHLDGQSTSAVMHTPYMQATYGYMPINGVMTPIQVNSPQPMMVGVVHQHNAGGVMSQGFGGGTGMRERAPRRPVRPMYQRHQHGSRAGPSVADGNDSSGVESRGDKKTEVNMSIVKDSATQKRLSDCQPPLPPSLVDGCEIDADCQPPVFEDLDDDVYHTGDSSERSSRLQFDEDKHRFKPIPISVKGINRPDFNCFVPEAKFFVVKSYSEDDVHKGIKYNTWSSTPNGNSRADLAYKVQQGKGPVFLFFSVNASGQFCGVASMESSVRYDKSSAELWQMDKWSGHFDIHWHMIKDVPNIGFRHILLPNAEGKAVTNSRDMQEVPKPQGYEMLNIMLQHASTTSILDDYYFYEHRQRLHLEKRSSISGRQRQLRAQNEKVGLKKKSVENEEVEDHPTSEASVVPALVEDS